jgi:hypothetical protein
MRKGDSWTEPSREKSESLDGNFIEYEIRRKGWPQRVSKEKEILDGFVISGPGLDNGAIRFIEMDDNTDMADTPWGKMAVQVQGRGISGRITITRAGEPQAFFDFKVGTYLDMSLSKDVKLRFRNRSFFVHKYRFDDKLGQIEIRTETKGLLKGGPFPNEWKKTWKIEFGGQLRVDKNVVLPPLAAAICYFKTIATGPWTYDTMF